MLVKKKFEFDVTEINQAILHQYQFLWVRSLFFCVFA